MNMVESEELEVPSKYLDGLPESLQHPNGNETALVQIRNSLLWLFYLHDLSKEKRDKIIQELLKIDYITKLNLYPTLDPLGVFLYFHTGYDKIISSIKRILKRINRYKISHPGLIATSLHSVWIQPFLLNENEYKLLVEIVKNPKGSFREWSSKTGISLSGVKYVFDRLKRKLFLRIWSQINFNAIKIKHYFIHVANVYNEKLRRLIWERSLKNTWLRSIWSFASQPDSLFISLTIPSHKRCVHAFLDAVKAFEKIGLVNIYEIQEIFLSYNLAAFDPKNGWNFSPSTWTMFSLSSLSEDYLDYLKNVSSVHRAPYLGLPNFKFSKKDLYLLARLFSDFRLKTTILSQISGYPLPTVSKKKKEFVEKKVIFPLPHIANIGLYNSLALLWEGESQSLEYLTYISAELPHVVGYRMREIYPTSGDYLLLFIWLPGTVSWDFIQNFSEIGKEIGLKEIFYEYKGSYSFTIDRYIHRWDEKRQIWNWSDEDFIFF